MQLARQTLRDCCAPAFDHRPAHAVAKRREQQPECRRQRRGQRLHRVRRRARQEGPARIGAEATRGVAGRRRPDERETGQRKRIPRHAPHGSQHVPDDGVQPIDQWSDESAVRRRIPAQVRCRFPDVAVERGGTSTAERVGKGQLGLAQRHTETGEVERAEEGRRDQHRMHGCADVVAETFQGQRLGARSTPDGRRTLVHLNSVPGPGQREGGSESVRSRPHDDGVGMLHGWTLPTAIGSPPEV